MPPPAPCSRIATRPVQVVNQCLWVYAIISIFFCIPLGCLSLVFLIIANGHEEKGNYGDALINARLARIFASLAIILSIVFVTISISLR
ncbi:CD225/dispanin family protein, partial [Salmonella sp. s51228]|uniref:CD225/dispanin family protein n=1 Tax=Salmonella sp. s51228 TaxID=3159652 RepID=UPI0039813E3D